MAHPIYVVVALACDGVAAGLRGAVSVAVARRASARRLFLASILYLPLVMALLVACRS